MKRNFTRVSVKLSAFLLVIYIVAVVARPSHEEYSEEEDDDDDDEDDVDDDDEDGYKLPSPSVIITDGIDGTHVQSLQETVGYLQQFVRRFIMPHLDPDLPIDHFPEWLNVPSKKNNTETSTATPVEQLPELFGPTNEEPDQQTDPAMPIENLPDWIISPHENPNTQVNVTMPDEQVFIPPELPMSGLLRPEPTEKPKPSSTKKPKPIPPQEEKPVIAQNVTNDNDRQNVTNDNDMVEVNPEMLRPEKIILTLSDSTTTSPVVVERSTTATEPAAVPEPAPAPPIEQEIPSLSVSPSITPEEPAEGPPSELLTIIQPVISPEMIITQDQASVVEPVLQPEPVPDATIGPESTLPSQSEVSFDPVLPDEVISPAITAEPTILGLPTGPSLPSELFGPSDLISGVVDVGMISPTSPQFEDVPFIFDLINQPAKEPLLVTAETSIPESVNQTPITSVPMEQSATLIPEELTTLSQAEMEMIDLPSMIAPTIVAGQPAPTTVPDPTTDLVSSLPGGVPNIPDTPTESVNIVSQPVQDFRPSLTTSPMEPADIQQNQFEMPVIMEALTAPSQPTQETSIDPTLAESFPPPIIIGSESTDPIMIGAQAGQSEPTVEEVLPSAPLTIESPIEQQPSSINPVLGEPSPPAVIVGSEFVDPMAVEPVAPTESIAAPHVGTTMPAQPELIVDEPHDPVDNLQDPVEASPRRPKELPVIQMLLLEEKVQPTARGLMEERKEIPVLTCHNCTIRMACTDCVKFRPELVLSEPSAFPMTITTPGLEIVAEPNIYEILANYSETNPARMQVFEMSNVDATINGNEVTIEAASEREMSEAGQAENIMTPNMQRRLLLDEASMQANAPLVVDEPVPIEIPVSMADTPIRPEAVKVQMQPAIEKRTMAGHDSLRRTKRSLPTKPNIVLKATLRQLI